MTLPSAERARSAHDGLRVPRRCSHGTPNATAGRAQASFGPTQPRDAPVVRVMPIERRRDWQFRGGKPKPDGANMPKMREILAQSEKTSMSMSADRRRPGETNRRIRVRPGGTDRRRAGPISSTTSRPASSNRTGRVGRDVDRLERRSSSRVIASSRAAFSFSSPTVAVLLLPSIWLICC